VATLQNWKKKKIDYGCVYNKIWIILFVKKNKGGQITKLEKKKKKKKNKKKTLIMGVITIK